LYNFIKHNR